MEEDVEVHEVMNIISVVFFMLILTAGHKRKASEMDVDLPGPSLSKRISRSSTVEDERVYFKSYTQDVAHSFYLARTPAVPSSATGRSSNKLKQSMTQIVILLNSNNHAELFRRPVTKKDAPDYAQAVQRPTDLAAIQRSIKAGHIQSWDELERELRRMLANCCVYNRPGTSAYKTAKLVRMSLARFDMEANESIRCWVKLSRC